MSTKTLAALTISAALLVGLTTARSARPQKGEGFSDLKLSAVTILVRDYDEAIEWYTIKLGLKIADNVRAQNGQRWVTLVGDPASGLRIILHKPGTGYLAQDKQLSAERIGKETYWLFETTDFEKTFTEMRQRGVVFQSEPQKRPYGTEATFLDLYGNLFALQQRTPRIQNDH